MKQTNAEHKIVADGFDMSKEIKYFEVTSNGSEGFEKLYRALITIKAISVQLQRAFPIIGLFNTKRGQVFEVKL